MNGRGWTLTDAPPAPLQREADPHEDPADPGGGASKPVGGMETCPWEVRFLCPTDLFASGLLNVYALNVQGVLAKNLTSTITKPSANALLTSTVISYRSTTTRREKGEDVMRVAVAMVMNNPGTAPWTAKDAALLVGKGQDVKQVKVWQLAPIPPGQTGLVMVETELLAQEERGTFILKLWNENGGRPVTLGGVTFP